MFRGILSACVICAFVSAKDKIIEKECKKCPDVDEPVCGSDGKSYSSFCELTFQECYQDRTIGFQCDGNCPCDPEELENLDPNTVHKLAKLRSKIQLEDHEEEEFDKESGDMVTFDILDNGDRDKLDTLKKEIIGEEDKGYNLHSQEYYNENSGYCPPDEMKQLPSRLIDWFHVLKTNEMEEMYKDQGIEREPILKEMRFIDAKLKSMYSQLACADTDDEVEREVCLTPVKWMFEHLDTDNNAALSVTELAEIEEINNEHCIKPFLRGCDANKDEKVVLKEFCRCLCMTPPCTNALKSVPTVLLKGRPKPFPGFFTPKCDEDGFFMPMQRNKRRAESWCVDRNGAEVEGTRKKGKVNCDLNTKKTKKFIKLIPLDMAKENAPTKSKLMKQ